MENNLENFSVTKMEKTVLFQPGILENLCANFTVDEAIRFLAAYEEGVINCPLRFRDRRDRKDRFLPGINPKTLQAYNLIMVSGLRKAFLDAVEKGQDTLVSIFLKIDPTVIEWRNLDKDDALTIAIENNRLSTLILLLDHGIPINSLDKYGHTLLMVAARTGNLEIVKYLYEEGADISPIGLSGYTPLLLAAEHGHDSVVNFLLDQEINIDYANLWGKTSLILAAKMGHLSVVLTLLNRGANINAEDNDRSSALVYAINQNHTEITRALLEHGANPNSTQFGNPVLKLAVKQNNPEIVSMLLEKEVDINSVNRSLKLAVTKDLTEIAKLLLNYQIDGVSANVNAVDRFGGTLLLTTIYKGNAELVSLLLSRGANIHTINNEGFTPMAVAKLYYPELLPLLREYL